MPLLGQKSIVIRCSPNADPDDDTDAVLIELMVWGVSPIKVNEAETVTYGGGKMRRGLKQRYNFKVSCRPFKVRAEADDSKFQDVGDLYRLLEAIELPHIWLWQAYGALSTGLLPRTDVNGEETFWNQSDAEENAGILPVKVVRPDIEPDPNFKEGTEELNFTLEAEDRIP